MGRYMFIDGEYLESNFRKQMQAFYETVPDINYLAINGFAAAAKVFYYDAIDYEKGPNESSDAFEKRLEAAVNRHNRIAVVPSFHVRDGHVKRSPKMNRRQQKGVDVLLAVEAMEHAARGNMNEAYIFTGDLDFEPLIGSLNRLGVLTNLVYFPAHTAIELMYAADTKSKITLQHFWDWSPLRFRESHPPVQFAYNEAYPAKQIYVPEKKGMFQGKRITLFSTVTDAPPKIYWERGDDMTEGPISMMYPDIEKLPLAFQLTFGEVKWDEPRAA